MKKNKPDFLSLPEGVVLIADQIPCLIKTALKSQRMQTNSDAFLAK